MEHTDAKTSYACRRCPEKVCFILVGHDDDIYVQVATMTKHWDRQVLTNSVDPDYQTAPENV